MDAIRKKMQSLKAETDGLYTTIQVLQPWTQMVQYGKELTSMTVRFTVKNNTKKMLMIFKLMVPSKKT